MLVGVTTVLRLSFSLGQTTSPEVVAEVEQACWHFTAQELVFSKALLCKKPDSFNSEFFFYTSACDGNRYYPIS